ncbi:MAG: hypothetical protein WC683_07320 [bacterium]
MSSNCLRDGQSVACHCTEAGQSRKSIDPCIKGVGDLVDFASMSDEEVEAYARQQERVSVRDRLCRYHGVRYVEELPATVQQKYFGRVLQHG